MNLTSFAKMIYSGLKAGMNVTINSQDPNFAKIVNALGMPKEIFSGFNIQDGSDKSVKITCSLKNKLTLYSKTSWQNSTSEIKVTKGN